ncbi:MAG: amidohydrolase family protein [Aquisalimonadaceae bacterium]
MSRPSDQVGNRDCAPSGAPVKVLANGRIITVDSRDAIAEAIAWQGDRIIAVGENYAVCSAAGDDAVVIDLGGRAVVPGLIDTHAHMDREGLKVLGTDLSGCRQLSDVLERIAAAAAVAEPGAWIVTMPVGTPPFYTDGPDSLKEGRLPRRDELDAVAPRNPVYIRPIWGYWRHAPNPECLVSAANSEALRASGISPDAGVPAQSVSFERDGAGCLTGIIRETTAMPIVELVMLDAASRFTARDRETGLVAAMRAYNRLGTTSIYEGHGVASELFRAYRACQHQGRMSVRAHLTHSPSWRTIGDADPARLLEQWAYWAGAGGLGDDWLRMEGLFVEHRVAPDDLVRAGAAPYTGWAGFHYDCALPREALREVLIAAARSDIRCVAIAPDLIDLLVEVNRVVPIVGRRWIVQHVGPLSRQRCQLAAELGLILTPLTTRYIYKEGVASPARQGLADESDYVPLARLADMGVTFSLASDNSPPSLWHSIWHAVARRDGTGAEVPGADQKLSRMQALRAATMGGARLGFDEEHKGSLEPGKLADLAVLSDDPLRCDEDVIPAITAAMTVVGGRIFHLDRAVFTAPEIAERGVTT